MCAAGGTVFHMLPCILLFSAYYQFFVCFLFKAISDLSIPEWEPCVNLPEGRAFRYEGPGWWGMPRSACLAQHLSHIPFQGASIESQLYSPFQVPAVAHPGRQAVMTEIFGSLPPVWDTILEFPVSGFFWLLPVPAYPVASRWRMSQNVVAPSGSYSHSLFLSLPLK